MLRNFGGTAANRIRNAGAQEWLLALAAMAVLLTAVFWISSLVRGPVLARQAPPEVPKAGLSPAVGTLEPRSGTVKLAENGGKALYLDTASLNVKVTDTVTGAEWNSIHDRGGEQEKSPVVIRFLGKDGVMRQWDAYTYAIQNGRYTLHRIEDGVRIVFDLMETESYRLNEYMPEKISEQRYRERFLDRLDELVAEGNLAAAQAQRYKESLELSYQHDPDNELYFLKFAGLPPLSLVKDLIALSKAVGYTTDMLIEDSQQFGIQVSILEPVRFAVTMEVTLDDGDLVVRVPTYEMKTDNADYTIQNIAVLPSFGLVPADTADDGYIFVPDGAGALFRLNSFNPKYPEYERPIYDNTYYSTLYEMPAFPEPLTMPVFGMYYTDPTGASQGFMGIIEKGAELAHLKVQLGAKDTSAGGTPFNKVFSSFDSMQYSRVKVFGPYSSNDARYLSTTGLIPVDYTVRYKLFGDRVTYFEMARTYRQYLMDTFGLEASYDADPKLFLDVLGTVTLEKRFLGVPYNVRFSMTKYAQLRRMLEEMQQWQNVRLIVNYMGALNGGLNNTVATEAELTKAGGSRKEWETLLDFFSGGRHTLFLSADLMKVAETGGGFRPRTHALRGYDGKPLEIWPYNRASGQFDMSVTARYLVHPLYLSDLADRFIRRSEAYPNLFLNDLGFTYYANYKPDDIVDPVAARAIVEQNLQKLAEHKTIALDNPHIEKIRYARYAANVSRESSHYGTMYVAVPFRQLVMNGLIEYTTLNVNLSPDRREYFLLQALELGSIPKFVLSAESADLLKHSEYSGYFSIQYDVWKEAIRDLLEEYGAGLAQIGSKEIVGHRMLAENVFETTYASGAKVIVNYNKFPVTAAGRSLDALGYIIEPKR